MKSTPALDLLARREALELALYTLKYLKHDDYVAVILPAGLTSSSHSRGSGTTEAVVFSRKQLKSYLNEPLAQTLSSALLTSGEAKAWAKTSEATTVELDTGSSLYRYSIAEQQGLTLLELFPLPTQ